MRYSQLSICLITLFMGCGNNFEEGEAALRRGDYSVAREYFAKVSSSDPLYQQAQSKTEYCDSWIHMLQADRAMKKHSWEEALAELRQVQSSAGEFAAVAEKSNYCRQWTTFQQLPDDPQRFRWLTERMEKYNYYCGYHKGDDLGSVRIICALFDQMHNRDYSPRKNFSHIFKNKKGKFYFQVYAGSATLMYNAYTAYFIPNPGIESEHDFRVVYSGITCVETYIGDFESGYSGARISPDYVFLNAIALPPRQYMNVLAKFIGVTEFKDRFETPVFKPTFRVAAIEFHNRDANGRHTQELYAWGDLSSVLSDLVAVSNED